jgi:hypothetical protein
MITTEQMADLGRFASDRSYSQTGEDGILRRLFECLGVSPGYLVDIGAGDGWTLSNTRALLERGWKGALFDVKSHRDVIGTHITDENVNGVLSAHNVPTEVDLLSSPSTSTARTGGYGERLIVAPKWS